MVHRLLRTALVTAALGLALPATGAELAQDPVLTSVPSTGAYARRNRFLEWHPVSKGRPLPGDSELHCPGGCTVRTGDGSTLTLEPGAHIRVAQMMFIPLGGPLASLGRRFDLLEGSVSTSVVTDPKRPRMLVLATPNDDLVALRPGQAQVVVGISRAGVACLQGGARVKRGKANLDLKPGEAASLGSSDTLLAARPLEAPPKWAAPSGKLDEAQPLAVSFGEQHGSPTLAWEPIKGASGYRIEMSKDPNFATVLASARVPADEHRFIAKDLDEGSYSARVIAFDADGIASKPSTPTSVRVVALRVPPGTLADANKSTIVAPEGASVQLSDSTKLEMAVDDHRFSPATGTWTVDGTPHVVRLRMEGDYGRESRFVIEPRSLRADVRLGPAWAHWPGDPIDIAVTIYDSSGRFDPTSVKPDLQVLVGTEPVDVTWQRDGTNLTARLAPRSATGPEVVRVIVRDQNGALLGRNFLEIEPSIEHRERALAKQ